MSKPTNPIAIKVNVPKNKSIDVSLKILKNKVKLYGTLERLKNKKHFLTKQERKKAKYREKKIYLLTLENYQDRSYL
jgi:ribosomal protein S21